LIILLFEILYLKKADSLNQYDSPCNCLAQAAVSPANIPLSDNVAYSTVNAEINSQHIESYDFKDTAIQDPVPDYATITGKYLIIKNNFVS